jgi:hypothetical protein
MKPKLLLDMVCSVIFSHELAKNSPTVNVEFFSSSVQQRESLRTMVAFKHKDREREEYVI